MFKGLSPSLFQTLLDVLVHIQKTLSFMAVGVRGNIQQSQIKTDDLYNRGQAWLRAFQQGFVF